MGRRSNAPKKNYVPEEIVFQTKPQIALDLIDHSRSNGVSPAAWTFDELYGRDSKFLDGLEQRALDFVGEIPSSFHGWLVKPRVIQPRRKQAGRGRPEARKRVAKRRPSCEVRNLVSYSPVFQRQAWQRYRIKDTSTGPVVWEIKWAQFWRKDAAGFPSQPHCLIVARHVLSGEVKYFLSNRVPGRKKITLRWLLRVAFSRWSIESVFREAKEELGLDHYECRGWQCVHRHFAVTALSHLFCARMREKFDPSEGLPGERLTIEQVRSAMNVYLSTTAMSRKQRYRTELDKQAYYQRRNQQAATSHRKTTIGKYEALGIDPDRIKSCIPKPEQ